MEWPFHGRWFTARHQCCVLPLSRHNGVSEVIIWGSIHNTVGLSPVILLSRGRPVWRLTLNNGIRHDLMPNRTMGLPFVMSTKAGSNVSTGQASSVALSSALRGVVIPAGHWSCLNTLVTWESSGPPTGITASFISRSIARRRLGCLGHASVWLTNRRQASTSGAGSHWVVRRRSQRQNSFFIAAAIACRPSGSRHAWGIFKVVCRWQEVISQRSAGSEVIQVRHCKVVASAGLQRVLACQSIVCQQCLSGCCRLLPRHWANIRNVAGRLGIRRRRGR